MAVRARLTAPREFREEWPWHNVEWSSLSASTLFGGERRLEAESYLAEGFYARVKLESRPTGWCYMGDLVDVWQPDRLKGTLVDPSYGVAFLSATQVFDLRPQPRKWLAADQIRNAEALRVESGKILVTRSGTVGRATLARAAFEGFLISDDLLRVDLKDKRDWGWIYAFLRSEVGIQMMQSAHYGHVIKHLEPSHLNSIPIPKIEDSQRQWFFEQAERILQWRNLAEVCLSQSEYALDMAFGLDHQDQSETPYCVVMANEIFCGRRRLEAAYYESKIRALLSNVHKNSLKVVCLRDVADRVWWMTRFSRNFGKDGTPYRSSDDLFAVSQISEKRVFLEPISNPSEYFVKDGWLLMACSGQTYGLNGSVTLATSHDEKFFYSHDLIRIAPNKEIRSGYLFAYLGHPLLGQRLAKRTAYGSSVPHLDPGDVEQIPIGRITAEKEAEIADLADKASDLRAKADSLERHIGREANEVIKKCIE